jgi:hypothetical protein
VLGRGDLFDDLPVEGQQRRHPGQRLCDGRRTGSKAGQ